MAPDLVSPSYNSALIPRLVAELATHHTIPSFTNKSFGCNAFLAIRFILDLVSVGSTSIFDRRRRRQLTPCTGSCVLLNSRLDITVLVYGDNLNTGFQRWALLC